MSRKVLVVITTNAKCDGVQKLLKDDRSYDILVIDYESSITNSISRTMGVEYVFESQGGYKYVNIKKYFNEHSDLIDKYDLFWLIDWDLDYDDDMIENFLKAASEYGFDLCQPSLSHQSNSSWNITLNVNTCNARITNFVEIMCPLFTRDALKEVIDYFDICYSGWGLDFLWAKKLEKYKLGIIDKVIIHHPKPISSHNWELPSGLTSEEELQRIIESENISLTTNILKFLL